MASNQTVLYIEDNPANVLLVEKIIKQHHPDVNLVSTHNAEKGLLLIYDSHPAVVLLDIGLPGMSGHQLLQLLRTKETMRDVPIIAISAYVSEADIEHGLAEGFDAYITKPIDVQLFVRTLDAALRGRASNTAG